MRLGEGGVMGLNKQAGVGVREGVTPGDQDIMHGQLVDGSGSQHDSTCDGPPVVSVLMPVLNESKTIDHLVRLLRLCPQVLEVLVVDDGSIDGTGEIASRAGASVMMSTLLGKGASMQDGLKVAGGDIVLFLDGDLLETREDLVARMTAPIIAGQADLVKAKLGGDAGPVTVLTARPLLSAFFPELATLDHPLGGIVAARRSLLGNLRLENDRGVDIGLLIDAAMKGARVAEVDIGRIGHRSQSLEALGDMAKQVTRVILDRAWRHDRLNINLVREMEEVERRTRAHLLPAADRTAGRQKFALLSMDGVLLEGRFVVELAERIEAQSELARFLDNQVLADAERTHAIASLFTGVRLEVFEETARSMPLMDGAIDTVVTLRRAGYTVGIVTDSFNAAAEIVRRRVFADFSVAHLMRFRNGVSTGEVTLAPAMIDPDGCPRHHCCKSNVIRRFRDDGGLMPRHSLAVGSGDNDICMLEQAGISIAFRPQSAAVEAAAGYSVNRSLTEVLDLLDLRQAATEDGEVGPTSEQCPTFAPILDVGTEQDRMARITST